MENAIVDKAMGSGRMGRWDDVITVATSEKKRTRWAKG